MKKVSLSGVLNYSGVLLVLVAAVLAGSVAFSVLRQRSFDQSIQAMRADDQGLETNDSINSDSDHHTENMMVNEDLLTDDTLFIQGDQTTSDKAISNETSESSDSDESQTASLAHLRSTMTFERNRFQDLFNRNSDFVGWIQVNDTRINYPIVKGRDNDYYLDHDFDRQPRRNGAIFMDYRNSGTWRDRHTIIYGHHTRDGSMFTDLLRFRRGSFYEQNRDLTIETLFGDVEYRVFAAYLAEPEPSFIRTIFDEPAFDAFVTEIRNRTLHAWDTDIEFGDQLLTLITCAYDFDDARMVVHAVRISE